MSRPQNPPEQPRPLDFSAHARQAFERYINRRFGTEAAVFLGGSVQRGEARLGSDVDAVVVLASSSHRARQRIKTVQEGVPIDLAVYTMPGLAARIDREIRMANPWVLDIVGTGDVISNPRNKVTRAARSMAQRQLQAGPPEFTPAQRRPALVEISELTDSLRSSKEPAEQRFLAAALLPKLAAYHLRDNGQWIGKNRGLRRRLKEFDPQYTKALDQAVFEDLGKRGDIGPLVALTEKTLKAAGGLNRDIPTDIDPEPGFGGDAPKM
ncbi:MAG: nucleotidyltransferase domain-containing protein [Pseudomonadota bacterium]